MGAPGAFFPAERGESGLSILDMVVRTTSSKLARTIRQRANYHGPLLYSTLPCRVQRFCTVTEGAYGDVHEVLAKHSLLAFASSGMSSELVIEATENLSSASGWRTKFPRLPVGVESGNRFGLQCPECARFALKLAGRRVSYCAHCIPYATRCPWHGCRLVCDRECSRFEALLSTERGQACAENSLRYGQVALSVSEDCPRAPLWPRILSILEQKGFVSEHGSLRRAELHNAVSKLYSAGFEDARLAHMVSNRGIFDTCLEAARRAGRAVPAPFLVVLLCAAEGIEASTVKHGRHALEVGSVPSDEAILETRRSQWSEHCVAHVDATCTELRRALPAVWSWLYRHDRVWLQENQRLKTSPSGGRRIHELPPFIDAAISNIRYDVREHPRGREPLPSAYQFRLALGMNETVFNQVPALMQAVGRYAQLPGCKEVFVSRRVHLAVEQLSQRGQPLDIATVSRAARLRISTVAELCSTHHRYDSKTFGPPRFGSSHLERGKIYAVLAPASDGSEAQSFAAASMDASKPDEAGPRTTGKYSGERR